MALVTHDGVDYECDSDTCTATLVGVPEGDVAVHSMFLRMQDFKRFTVRRISQLRVPNERALRRISVPNTVTLIGKNAFIDCRGLLSVMFEAHAQTEVIEAAAFCRCTSLRSVEFPDTLRRICRDAFLGCVSIEQVVFPDNSKIEEIESFAFANCRKISYASLPDTIKSLGRGVFLGCPRFSRAQLGGHFHEKMFVDTIRDVAPVFCEISEDSLRQFRNELTWGGGEIDKETITIVACL